MYAENKHYFRYTQSALVRLRRVKTDKCVKIDFAIRGLWLFSREVKKSLFPSSRIPEHLYPVKLKFGLNINKIACSPLLKGLFNLWERFSNKGSHIKQGEKFSAGKSCIFQK